MAFGERRNMERGRYTLDPRVAAMVGEVQRLREELAEARERSARLEESVVASLRGQLEPEVLTPTSRAALSALESLARQLIASGGYSTPQQQAELRHAVALLAEHGVDVRAQREVQP